MLKDTISTNVEFLKRKGLSIKYLKSVVNWVFTNLESNKADSNVIDKFKDKEETIALVKDIIEQFLHTVGREEGIEFLNKFVDSENKVLPLLELDTFLRTLKATIIVLSDHKVKKLFGADNLENNVFEDNTDVIKTEGDVDFKDRFIYERIPNALKDESKSISKNVEEYLNTLYDK